MLNWDEIIIALNPTRSGEIDQLNYQAVSGREISTSEQLDYSRMIREIIGNQGSLEDFVATYSTEESYAGPFNFDGYTVTFWVEEVIEFAILFKSENYSAQSWLLQALLYVWKFGMELSPDSLLKVRYDFPSIVSRGDSTSNRVLEDPFVSIPETYFRSIVFQDPFDVVEQGVFSPVIQEITSFLAEIPSKEYFSEEDGRRIHRLFSDLLSPSYPTERYYLGLNLLDAISFAVIEKSLVIRPVVEVIQEQIEYLKLQGYSNLAWIFSLYLNFFFDSKIPVEHRPLDDYEVPKAYLLIPQMRRVMEEHGREENLLLHLLDLNQEIVSEELYFIGQEYLYEMIGYLSIGVKDYQRAATFFNLAADMYDVHLNKPEAQKSRKNAIQANLRHFSEFATAANLHHYLGEPAESMKFAWRGMNIAVSTISLSLEISLDFCRDIVEDIMMNIDQCKRPLLQNENEMTPVVKLKLDELEEFLRDILQEQHTDPKELNEIVLMHQESIKFMMPSSPPLFLLLTTDGRLIYSVKATSDLQSEEINISHLMAGVLTAVRSIFQEASFSGGGSVKEISTGDSTLLIEARDKIVIVASAISMSQEIRTFTNEMADHINDSFAGLIESWDGSVTMVNPIVEYFNENLKSTLLS